jgi:hypothetical protein
MMKVPKKVSERFGRSLKHFQPIALAQKNRDVSEADTVTLVKDILSDMFGYDKYIELTSELQIRGTFCDLAVKIEGKIKFLIEVKSAGVTLNDSHLRQALTYASHQGIEWVALTNGITWILYRVKFGQPIDQEHVSTFDLLTLDVRNEDDVRRMFLLCREGFVSNAMATYHQHSQLLNKYTVAKVVLSDAVVSVVRRELKRLFPDLKVDNPAIADILSNEVLKREVIEGDKVKEVEQRIRKASAKSTKLKERKTAGSELGNAAHQPPTSLDPSIEAPSYAPASAVLPEPT